MILGYLVRKINILLIVFFITGCSTINNNISNIYEDIFVKVQENQGSGILRSMSEADCLVILEHDEQTYEAGDKVSVLIFDGLQESGE